MAKIWNVISVAAVVSGMLSGAAEAQVTKDNLDQNADQSQGNYAATNLNYLGGGGSLGMMQSAWKDPLQHMGEGQTRPGYTKYYWTPELVLPVRVREGMYTLINFPEWEIIENVYLGDGQSFNAEIQGPSSLMVYPDSSQFVGVDTNMIVFGRSGNKYVFYVQSETVNTDRITNAIIDIEVVKKRNGSDGKIDAVGGSGGNGHINANSYSPAGSSADATFTRDLQKEDWIERIPVDPTKFRFDIEVYVPNPDDIIIAPERVWRDNIFTYIDLGDKALSSVQRPIVTLIVERSETPVGFRTAGPNNRLIIVEGMGDMVLRSGKRIVCLKLRRADSDGLENTVYAKTNEWDLQAPKNLKTESEDEGTHFEDVYGTPSAQTTDKNAATLQQSNGRSFWESNSFSSDATSNGNKGQTDETDLDKEKSSPQAESFSSNKSDEASKILDSLPKTSPVVLNQTKEPAEDVTLSGQYNVKADGTELITPSYNKAEDVSVTYQQDKTQSVPSAQTASSGVSVQDTNPVLITPKKETDGGKTFVSAETEALLKEFRNRKTFNAVDESNISIELGTDEDVNNLEKLWSDISKNYSAAIGKYQPFYSVDTAADGQGKELFHLRIGPVKSLEDGDNICSQLGRNGIFCSVVRIQ